MTLKKVLKLVEKHQPATEDEFKTLGIKLQFIGEGAFRRVFKIKKLDVVVKFPHNPESWGDYDHAVAEIKTIKALHKKKYKKVWKYLPKVYYTNVDTGVIIMRKYTLFPYHWDNGGIILDEGNTIEVYRAINRAIEVMDKLKIEHSDVEINNCGHTKSGQLKVLDFGCFCE